MNETSTPIYEPAHTRALRWRNAIELPDARFARLLRLTQKMLDVPIARLCLQTDDDLPRVQGTSDLDVGEIRRVASFCEAVPREERATIVEDVARDERFAGVAAESDIRFYAGHRLEAPDGGFLGTLCLMDRRPRELSATETELLADIAEMAQSELHQRALETIDEVTKLSNRRGFLFIGSRALALRDRAGEPVALASFELADLRAVDLGYSSLERGSVLREFGRLLTESFRDSDVVARLCDNQFCALVSPDRPDDVQIPLDRLQEAVDRWNRSTNGARKIRYRHHVIDFDSEQDHDLEGLLAAAAEETAAMPSSDREIPPSIGGGVSLLRQLGLDPD